MGRDHPREEYSHRVIDEAHRRADRSGQPNQNNGPDVIGFIRDIDAIASRHLPTWRKAVAESDVPFALTRRLFAIAIGQHLRGQEAGRDYIDEFVTLPGREIPIRVYRGEHGAERPTIVYFHGGGWVSGNLDTHHGLCRLLREKLAATVVSVHTRRAPENRHPAQIDDAVSTIEFLKRCNGMVELGPAGLILAGDSAGAFVAFRTALALDGWDRLKGLLLFYPALEPCFDKTSFRRHANAPGLTTETVRLYWHALIGGDEGLRSSLALECAPGLDRLPPTAVMVAEHDPLHDDGAKLVALLTTAGRLSVSITAMGATHGFCRMVQRDARARAWVERLLSEFGRLLP